MPGQRLLRTLIFLTMIALLWSGGPLNAQIAVRHKEGLVHGFLRLSTMEGKPLANGDLAQLSHGNTVTSRLTFRFNDGSLREETAVFSQRGKFRLLDYHLIQKGPAFRNPMEMRINISTGQVDIHYTDDGGEEKTASERMKLPPDLANGLIFTLLKNVRPDDTQVTMSMLAATPKPRLVKIKATTNGEEPFSAGGAQHKAIHYVLKIEIGGVSGVIAPLIGKQPPDIDVWILRGEAPAFVKSEGQLSMGGPIWRIELASPVFPSPAGQTPKD